MNNAEYIALQRGRYRAAGLAAATTEQLVTCPCCGTPNFSARGLAAHCCRAKPDRERLTPQEIERARARAATRPSGESLVLCP